MLDDVTASSGGADQEPSRPQEPISRPETGEGDQAEWKAMLRRRFEEWLAEIDEISPEEFGAGAEIEEPDLHAFYEQLATANVESRKANRRSAEAFSQWTDLLGKVDADLRQTRDFLARVQAESGKADQLPRAARLMLLEVLDRLRRLAAAFAAPPARKWWGGDKGWQEAWQAQRQASDIIIGHMEAYLKNEGVTRIETLGKLFNPALMIGVETVQRPDLPHHTVIEEFAAGYLSNGEVLRLAQVKVTINPVKNEGNNSRH